MRASKSLAPIFVGSHDGPRRRLVEAAASVFAVSGYNASTVRQICASANMNVAAVNYHFGDKLALYGATLRFLVETEGVPRPVSGLELLAPEEALRAFLHDAFEHYAETSRPALYSRIMLQEFLSPTPGLGVAVEWIIRPRMDALTKVVASLLNLPTTDIHTRLAVCSVIGQALHYVQARALLNHLWPDWELTPVKMKSIIDYVADFSIAALKGMRQAR